MAQKTFAQETGVIRLAVRATLVIFGLAVILSTAVALAARQGAAAPPSAWLAFTADPEQVSHLYRMRLVDGQTQRASDWPRGERYPAFSPDGAWLAFECRDVIAQAWLCVMPSDGGQVRFLQPILEYEGNIAWSPDSVWIGFVAKYQGAPQVYRVRPDGSGVRRLTPAPNTRHTLTWSPDGRWITFIMYYHGERDLFRIPANGGEELRLTDQDLNNAELNWSPDGEWLAYLCLQPGVRRPALCRVRFDGTARETVLALDDDLRMGRPIWSPDGEWITIPAMQTDVAGLWYHIYRVRPDGGDLQDLIGRQAGVVSDLQWSPDGRWLAFDYSLNGMITDLYRIDASGANLEQLTYNTSHHAWGPHWSPPVTVSFRSVLALGVGVGCCVAGLWLRAKRKE